MNGPFFICLADHAGYLPCQGLISFGVSYRLSILYSELDQNLLFPLSEPFLLLQIPLRWSYNLKAGVLRLRPPGPIFVKWRDSCQVYCLLITPLGFNQTGAEFQFKVEVKIRHDEIATLINEKISKADFF